MLFFENFISVGMAASETKPQQAINAT